MEKKTEKNSIPIKKIKLTDKQLLNLVLGNYPEELKNINTWYKDILYPYYSKKYFYCKNEYDNYKIVEVSKLTDKFIKSITCIDFNEIDNPNVFFDPTYWWFIYEEIFYNIRTNKYQDELLIEILNFYEEYIDIFSLICKWGKKGIWIQE